MLNSYASGGNATSSSNNYLKINAISGTLVKNHPKSIFVTAKLDSPLFDPTNPRCVFPKAETYIATEYIRTYGATCGYETCDIQKQRDVEVPCVVLQSMIVSDGLFLCEIVKRDDFFINDERGDDNA